MEEEWKYQVIKLTYPNKEIANQDLFKRGTIDENGNYINGTQAIVYMESLGKCNVDLMTSQDYVFRNEILPSTPDHEFAGWTYDYSQPKRMRK